MLISLQGAEWHGTKLHTGHMCAGVNCFYPLCSPLRNSWRPVIPRTRRRLGNRAFSVAGPAARNSLPPDIRTASTLCTFKNLLKTHLFLLLLLLFKLVPFESVGAVSYSPSIVIMALSRILSELYLD